MYGINALSRKSTLKKMRDTSYYLDNHFVKFGNDYLPYSHFFKNSFINSQRYIAEIQNRVWSIYNYARSKELVNVFFSLSLPTEYHSHKQILKGKAKGKLIKNSKYNSELTPKVGSKKLSELLSKIWNDRIWREIPLEFRCFFRVIEPHKDGTPHLHVSFFIPEDKVERFVNMLNRLFPEPQGKVVTKIDNPVAYLMKYILKTLDDLRFDNENVTDLTLWYVHHGICRLYTSRTLISLDVYRVLGGRYSMNELSIMYKEKRLTVYVDPITNKPSQIFDEFGQIWTKKLPINVNFNQMRQELKPKLKEKTKTPINVNVDGYDYLYSEGNLIDVEDLPFVPSLSKNYQLYEHYNSLDIETCDPKHFGLVQNECIRRHLIEGKIQSLNDFSTNPKSIEYENPYIEQFDRFEDYLNSIPKKHDKVFEYALKFASDKENKRVAVTPSIPSLVAHVVELTLFDFIGA